MRNVVVHRDFLRALFMLTQNRDAKIDEYHANVWSAIHNLSVNRREQLDDVARYPLRGDKRLMKHNNAEVVWCWSGDEVHVHDTFLVTL